MTYKSDFPLFTNHPELIYLDSAATTQKPRVVIERIQRFYTEEYATIHRGMYPLSIAASEAFEAVREQVRVFIDAPSAQEIIFTRGATESLNLLAHGLGKKLQSGDEIILSLLEHHANLLPWQQVATATGAKLQFVNLTPTGELDLAHLATLITNRTRVVSLSLCSNVLGSVLPLTEVKKILQNQGSSAVLIADGCQALPHFPVSVAALGCDFLVFSAHKLYAPSGVGVLWGRAELLKELPPYQTGGDMVKTASLTEAEWNEAPSKFEAGTPTIEGVIGFGAALTYLSQIGMEEVAAHTSALATSARQKLEQINGLTILGNPNPQSGIISFTVAGIHPHDLAQFLGEQQVCIRAGHHCAAPLHQALNIPASNRISFGLYSTESDVDAASIAIQKAQILFHG